MPEYPASRSFEIIVVGLHLRWHGVRQRPNHILCRLAERTTIVVVEEELAGEADDVRIAHSGAVIVVTPERKRPAAGVDAATIAAVRALVAGRPALLWLYTPLMLELANAVPGAPIVYDKMDELAAFRNADPSLAERETILCARAEIVFAGGRSLWESVRDRARAGGSFPSAVDAEPFAAAAGAAAAARLPDEAAARPPIFGYVGVIDERLDLELIARIAAANRDTAVAMIGPVAKIDPAELPRAENIAYLGKRDYDELPALIASFAVALMPFALNAATRYISPTKTLEYLAARRPVVSTAVPDVVADFSDIVYIARDAADFIAALDIARRGDPARADAGAALAARVTWDALVAEMLQALERVHIRIGTFA